MTTTDSTPTDESMMDVPHPIEAQEPPQVGDQAPDLALSPEAAQGVDRGQDKPPANREARYRTERNEARAQVAELTERISRMQETEATRLAAELLHDPGDLVLFGALPDVLDDEGMVDSNKVQATARQLIAARPGLAKGARVRASSFGQGRRTPVDSGHGVTWSSVLRGHE